VKLPVRGRLALLLMAMYVLTEVVLQLALIVAINIRHPSGPPSSVILLVRYCAALAITAAIACGLAWLAAGRMLRPLRRITDTARRITGEDLHERLALGGPADELTELADTFDAMLARLEAAFTDQQLFAANAAHELRTRWPSCVPSLTCCSQALRRHQPRSVTPRPGCGGPYSVPSGCWNGC
jgi:nitrate/nitrite-specific signal transduction histidine kinase